MLVSINEMSPCPNESDIFPMNVFEKLPTIFVNLFNSVGKSKLKLSTFDATDFKFDVE